MIITQLFTHKKLNEFAPGDYYGGGDSGGGDSGGGNVFQLTDEELVKLLNSVRPGLGNKWLTDVDQKRFNQLARRDQDRAIFEFDSWLEDLGISTGFMITDIHVNDGKKIWHGFFRNINEQGIAEGSAANDYFTRRKSEEDRIAGVKAPAKNKKNPANTDYAKKRKQQDVTEAGHDHRRRAAASHDDEECSSCDGTGEGRHEGQSCGACGGSGVARGQYDHDDFDIPDKDDMYEGVTEGSTQKYEMMLRNGQVKRFVAKDDADAKRIAAGHGAKSVIRMKGNVPGDKIGEQGVAEGQEENIDQFISGNSPNFNGESNRVSADTAQYNFINFLEKKGFNVDYINDQAYPVLVAICQGKMCAWYDFKNAYGYVSKQGVAEGSPKDPNAPKLVQDRKTGKWYDPNKEFEKKMTSPEVKAQMKRMAQKEGVAEATGDSKFDTMMGKISRPAMKQAEQQRKLSTIQSIADAVCNDLKCDYDDLTDQDLQFIADEASASMYDVMSVLGRQQFNIKRNIGKWDDEDINEQGVAEGSEIKIPTEDGITMQDIRLMAGEGPLTKKTVLQAIAVIRKQRRPQGVAEATDPTRGQLQQLIWNYFGQICDYGDDGLEYLDRNGELFNELMHKYNGEIADIVAREPTAVLMQAAQELKDIAGDMKYELDEQGVAEGLTEMDKTQTPPGRDGDIDWSKKQIHLGPEHVIKGKDVAQHALKALDKSMKKSHPNTLKKKGVAEGQVPPEVTHRHDINRTADIEVLGVDHNAKTFNITYNKKPYTVKASFFSQEDFNHWQIPDYEVEIINSNGKNLIDMIDWQNAGDAKTDRQIQMIDTIIAYLDTQRSSDIQYMSWLSLADSVDAEELYNEITDFYEEDQQKIDQAAQWLSKNIPDANARREFAAFVQNPRATQNTSNPQTASKYLMYVAFSYSREGNTEMTPGMKLPRIQLNDPDDEGEFAEKLDALFNKVNLKFDAFENKIIELGKTLGFNTPDVGSGFEAREMYWDQPILTSQPANTASNTAKNILKFKAAIDKYVQSFSSSLTKIGLPGITEYSTWEGVLSDKLTTQQQDYFATPEGFANIANGRIDVSKMINDNMQRQGVAEGLSESVSLRDMVNVVDEHYPKYYAELSGSDISDKQFEKAIVNAYKKIMQKQGAAEAIRPDVMRHQGDKTIKIVKRAGKPIGEIGIDAEASSGIGSYYVKMYDGSYDAVGFHTAEEALAELKDIIKQTMAEGLNENAEDLHIGDPVIITGNGIEFEGATGEIINFGQQHRFVVVDLYNHGRHSFHSSDVSFNEYAGSNDEEARMYDAGEFGDDDRDDMNESLMNKLQQALVNEGRVKELADDLKTLNDTEFMKKYGKAKAAIRKDMKKLHEAVSTLSPEQLAYNQLRAQIDSANFLRGGNTANTVVNTTPEVQASQANMNNKLAQMAAALKAKGIDAAAEYDAPEPGAAPAQSVDLNQKYNSKNKVQQPVAAAPVPLAQPGVAEARTSAAQRLSTAWDRQRAKSNASLARTPGSIPKKQEPKKADPVPKTVSEHRAKRQALMAQMLNGH